MKKKLLVFFVFVISGFSANAQQCLSSGFCSNFTNQYPSSTFSTTSSTWTTVSAYMNAGNWTLFNVTSGNTYEWSYCEAYGGVSTHWDTQLTLLNNSTSQNICFSDNTCGTTGNAPYISWTATFTGVVKLLTSQSNCASNTGSPYNTLVWRQANGVQNTAVLGIDVSHYDGTINWTQVKTSPYNIFAWCKGTDGTNYTDPTLITNMTDGTAAGVVMGAYHFGRPLTNANATAEANYFLSVCSSYIGACFLPPVLDLEDPSSSVSLTGSMSSSALTAWAQQWMTTVQQQTGIAPVLYTNGSIASYLNSSINTYGLWIANPNGSTGPPTNIGVWNTWTFKQYSFTGNVAGINNGSNTDLNVFNGNMTDFNNLIGCSTSITPVASFTSSINICEGHSVMFIDNSTNNPTSWSWTMPNGTPATSTSQNPSVTYSTAGTYTVTLVASNSSGASSPVSHTITVNANPAVPTTSLSGNVLTSSSTTGNQWLLNGVAINGATNQTYTVTANGLYSVLVTNSFGCSSASAQTSFVSTGISSIADNSTLTIFPNPSNGTVNINFVGKSEHINIEVINNLGQLVYTDKINDCNNDCNKIIDMTSFKKGIYLFRITANGNIQTKKLVLIE